MILELNRTFDAPSHLPVLGKRLSARTSSTSLSLLLLLLLIRIGIDDNGQGFWAAALVNHPDLAAQVEKEGRPLLALELTVHDLDDRGQVDLGGNAEAITKSGKTSIKMINGARHLYIDPLDIDAGNFQHV